jgi:uncharacterized coiled-coil protein SlyX
MSAERFERIETKIAFLEHANAELSDIAFRQHRELEALRAQMAALTTRVEAAHSESGVRTPEQELPPHY